ncbi:hypothetical protein [Actinacidiphila rubida]|uniref:SH3 domain-containing protein n=1 Tax=Actinacidiphila rubida TaxID=310780 RepID=A0A1H8EEV6_9ACTN|nr:hypothetical protein [Actinacidiphila rubida]SEN17644.1 hypothetical protein SAMN05216267_1002151 [Actinacidiphila rubida]
MVTWLKQAKASGTVLLAAAAALGFAGGTAHADSMIDLNRTVGVYSAPNASSGKVAPDLHAGDAVQVNCWTVGGNVGNAGDVWYHAVTEVYPSGESYIEGWVFGPYADGAALFHNGGIPQCP